MNKEEYINKTQEVLNKIDGLKKVEECVEDVHLNLEIEEKQTITVTFDNRLNKGAIRIALENFERFYKLQFGKNIKLIDKNPIATGDEDVYNTVTFLYQEVGEE